MSNSLTDWKRKVLDPSGSSSSRSMNDLIKIVATGSLATKQKLSMADLLRGDQVTVKGNALPGQSISDVAYAATGTGMTQYMSMADKAMKELTAGGTANKEALDMLAYRKDV